MPEPMVPAPAMAMVLIEFMISKVCYLREN